MKTSARVALAVSGLAAGTVALAWLGRQVRPAPFSPYSERTPPLDTVHLPGDLPAPVSRFYHTIAGDTIPVVHSAVITGRASLRFRGIQFPARLRFTHDAGRGYRHYIEATFFGRPLMKVNERYLDGEGRMELPFGTLENEPRLNMAANLGLWGESLWLPSIFVTDPRVRWEPIDSTHARLVVPFEGQEDAFVVTFDATTGLISTMDAMRYREATDPVKTPWRLEAIEWLPFQGILLPSVSSVTWEDEGVPWLVIHVDDVVYNVDVSDYIRARGL